MRICITAMKEEEDDMEEEEEAEGRRRRSWALAWLQRKNLIHSTLYFFSEYTSLFIRKTLKFSQLMTLKSYLDPNSNSLITL